MNDDEENELKKPSRESLKRNHEDASTVFDTIENEFNTVMNGLEGDTKFFPFRLQYEKLFKALKKSVQHEQFLAKKCVELSAEVTQNVSKVRDVLKVSQQDKNAIVMLKQDTEKAWALVDEGKKKELTISETVDRFQEETNKLSQQLQEERTRALKQDEDLRLISQDRNNLKSQRDEYLRQVDDLERREKEMGIQLKALDDDVKDLATKNTSLNEEQKQNSNDLVASIKRHQDREEEIEGLKLSIKQKSQDCIDLEHSTSMARKKSDDLSTRLNNANKKVEEQASECEALSQQTVRLTEMLELQKNKMLSIDEGFKNNREDLKAAIAAQHAITSEKSQLQRKYDSELRNVSRIQRAVGDARADCQLSKKEILGLQQESDKSNQREDQTLRQMATLKRERDLLQDKIQRLEQKAKESNDEFLHNKQAMMNLEKELSHARGAINSFHKRLHFLDKASEKHNNYLSQERTSKQRTKEEVRLKDIELQEMKKELGRWEMKSSDEFQMCNQLRVERGKLSRQLVRAQEEIQNMKDRINILSNEAQNLRHELTMKDEFLVKESFEVKREKAQKEQATAELSRVKQHIDDQESTIQKQDLMIRRYNSTVKRMDDDAMNQRKEYDQIVNERDVLGAQLIRRNDELALMQERMKMQETALKKGEIQYQERIDEIRQLKNVNQDLRRELRLKKEGIGDEDRVSRELTHKDKELLQEKVKVKALSEELENPLNVHRWRKLEGSDPTAFELIQKIDLLQKRLIKKSEQVIEKDAIIKENDKQYNMLKKQLGRQPGLEMADKLNERDNEVREKERQMRAMAGELNMNQTQVSDSRKEIGRLHHELHALKDKFFELKKKESAMKERELQWLAESGMMELDRVCHEQSKLEACIPQRRSMHKPIRYVGGGFRAIPHLDAT